MLYRSEQIRDDHVLDSFSCGNDYLDGWLRRSAVACGRKNVARTYVWADDDAVVWAYLLWRRTKYGEPTCPGISVGVTPTRYRRYS